MDVNLKAGEFLIALEWGYASLDEVISWADHEISESENPKIEFIDLSLSKSNHEAITVLRGLSKGVDDWMVLRFFFNRFSKIEKLSVSDASKLARHLYMKCTYQDTCPEDLLIFSSHWDDIDLARDRIIALHVDDAINNFLADMRRLSIRPD